MKAKHDTTFGAWRVSTRDGYGRLLVHRNPSDTNRYVNLDCVATAPGAIIPLQVGHFERRGGNKRDAADLRRALEDIFAGDLARANAAAERGRQRVAGGPDGSEAVRGPSARPGGGWAGYAPDDEEDAA